MVYAKHLLINFLFLFLFLPLFTAQEPEEKKLDSITGATLNKKEPLRLKKEENILPVEEEKKPTVKKEIKKEIKQRPRFIEFVDEDKRITESEIENMMLFDFDKNALLEDVYELDLSNEMIPWYRAKDFVPDSLEDFIKAEPDYTFNKDKIIIPGAVKLKSELGEKIFSAAYGLYKKNEIQKAKPLFIKLVNYNHRILESYYYLSWCHYLSKDYFTAILYMKECIKNAELEKHEPTITADYYYQTGCMYLKIEDYSNAVGYIKAAIEKAPASYAYYNNLGIIYYKLGDFENAKNAWKKGVDGKDINSSKNYLLINK